MYVYLIKKYLSVKKWHLSIFEKLATLIRPADCWRVFTDDEAQTGPPVWKNVLRNSSCCAKARGKCVGRAYTAMAVYSLSRQPGSFHGVPIVKAQGTI